MVKDELTLNRFKISSWHSLLLSATKRDSLILDFNLAIRTLNTIHGYPAFFFINWVSLRFLFLKDKHTGLVIIQNSDAGTRIFSGQALSSRQVIAFDIKVFIRLPSFIVYNLHRNFSFSLATPEIDFLINSSVIFVCKSITVQCPHTNGPSLLCFVKNFNAKCSCSLTN